MLGQGDMVPSQGSRTGSCKRSHSKVQDNEEHQAHQDDGQVTWVEGNILLVSAFTQRNTVCQIYLRLWLPISFSSVTIARWVSEAMRPFRIVKDRGLRWLCKTGRPHFYLPDETTVAKDVKFFYGWAERQLAEELQVNFLNDIPCVLTSLPKNYEGFLAYQLDCWTSPNHRAFMNVFVTWIRNGNPVTMILNFIELPKSHTGRNMAQALFDTLERYGIAHKVSTCST